MPFRHFNLVKIMSEVASILDKVLENKQAEELYQFDPQLILQSLFSELNEREQEVLVRRFGLSGEDAQTLEIIGKHFGVTRERVRQIETGSIKKLKNLETLAEQLKMIEQVLFQVLDQHGGIMEEMHLLDSALQHRDQSLIERAILIFFLEKLLAQKFDRWHDPEHYHRSWKLVSVNDEAVKGLIDDLIKTVDGHSEPIEEDQLIKAILDALEAETHERVVKGHLRIAKKLKKNIFGKWGRSHWNSITPKRMNDKVYLVLQDVNRPLHFTEIAEKINELNFDHKTAYPATVHNELILDDKYVLVGRGIYALSDWGYQPGVVADVISRVLEEAGSPLAREAIVEKVLEQRIVGKSTVHLALMNKQRFSKLGDGRYQLLISE